MDRVTHVIDPNGEVIIVLQNPNAPFAEKPVLRWPALAVYEPATSEPPVYEPAAEEPAACEPVAYEPVAYEPAAEEPAAEEPATEELPELGVAEQLDKSCFRIRVSAKHLTLASSFFRKTLTGGWKESTTYLQKGFVEINADGWDIEALLIMLRIVHCQSSDVPRKLTLEMLAKVAVLADYYHCRKALEFFTDTWINALDETIPTTNSRDLIIWLWVAWYFHLPAKFKEATSTVMTLSNDRIDNLGLPIPEDVINSMDNRREEAIANLVHQLHVTLDELRSASKGCGYECSSIMYGALAKQMHLNALLSPRPAAPFLGLRYRILVQRVTSFKSPEWYGPRPSSSRNQHRCIHSSFTSLFGVLEDTIEGFGLNRLSICS
ncbi:hypothetical protein BDV09DRAFT_204892 [Aspergillus tetrazonus]